MRRSDDRAASASHRDRWDDDKLREECGVFGIFGNDDAAAHTVLGLHALQHRGQEAAGVVTFDGRMFHSHRALGPGRRPLQQRGGDRARCRATPRSATSAIRPQGAPLLRNVQPLFADFAFGGLALGHNGNLTNALTLRRQLVEQGCLFQSTSDTEVIIHLIARSRQPTVVERLVDALRQVQGAYALVALSGDALYGVRDPLGVRPLVLGDLDGAPILASETCALDIMGARFVRDVEPGEVVHRDRRRHREPEAVRRAAAALLHLRVCLLRAPRQRRRGPQRLRGPQADRRRAGAEEQPAPADIVIPVPDSGVPAAIGYAQAAGLPFELGLIRNHYVGRTFIEPSDRIRHLGVKLKHNANRATVAGRRVVLVDDSIVRGTTSTKIVAMVRACRRDRGAHAGREPADHPFLLLRRRHAGARQLLAAHNDLDAMARIIGVDSLGFLSLDGLYRAVGGARRDAGAAAVLRCLLQRRLSDRARGLRPGRQRPTSCR